MNAVRTYGTGLALTALLATVSVTISGLIPYHLISGSVFALLIGMLLNPAIKKYSYFKAGIQFSSKQVLRVAIVLMGLTLSFSQVLQAGQVSLAVMIFTLSAAFGGGYLLGKMLKMNWKLAGLISAGTGICGGSAVAAIAPTIEAQDRDIAYAISATFLFDVLMVILFPIAGRYFGMSDMGFGLWAGTAVNDTSSVVAAGYAFSDTAGAYSVIVKLTRTLAIIPAVLTFSLIHRRLQTQQASEGQPSAIQKRVKVSSIFPYFILVFLIMVGIKSTGFVSDSVTDLVAKGSKFLMVMALGAIGLKTSFKELSRFGFKPMLLGFMVSTLVVVVSFLAQMALGQV